MKKSRGGKGEKGTLVPGASAQIAHELQKKAEANDRDNRYIRGSGVGFCSRKIGYSLLGYQPSPSDAHNLLTLNLGNAIHDMVQKWFLDMGWVKAERFLNERGEIDWRQTDDPMSGCELDVVDHELRILGHLDGITVPMKKRPGVEGLDGYYPDPDGERYLLEIKTITDRSRFWVLGIRDGGMAPIREEEHASEFIDIDEEVSSSGNLQQRLSRFSHERKVISSKFGTRTAPVYKVEIDGKDELVTVLMIGNSAGSFSNLEAPKDAHIAQASLYASHWGIQKILFIYIAKDADPRRYPEESLLNFPVKVFEHEVSEEDVDGLRDKINRIYRFVDDGLLPPREFAINDDKGECKFCPFARICYPGTLDVVSTNKQLESLGMKTLEDGPGVMHSAKADLREEFEKNRPA